MSKIQKIYEDMLRLAMFNNLDGEFVANTLNENRELWKGYIFGNYQYFDLIQLRDMEMDSVSGDTMMILTTKDKLADLLILINRWSADEVSYNLATEDKTSMRLGGGLDKNYVVVRVWWD